MGIECDCFYVARISAFKGKKREAIVCGGLSNKGRATRLAGKAKEWGNGSIASQCFSFFALLGNS
jgi:hypothetical protein